MSIGIRPYWVMLASTMFVSTACMQQGDVRTLGDLNDTQHAQVQQKMLDDEQLAEISRRREESYAKYLQQVGKVDRDVVQRYAEIRHERWRERYDGVVTDETSRQSILAVIELYEKALSLHDGKTEPVTLTYQLAQATFDAGDEVGGAAILEVLLEMKDITRYEEEVWLRLGEYYFGRENFVTAAEHYARVIDRNSGNSFYRTATYKHAWSMYRLARYREAMEGFIVVVIDEAKDGGHIPFGLDDGAASSRSVDAIRYAVISLDELGGMDELRRLESGIDERVRPSMYVALAEYYEEKGQVLAAGQAYGIYLEREYLDGRSIGIQRKLIDMYSAAGFRQLMLDEKHRFVDRYQATSEFWKKNDRLVIAADYQVMRDTTRELARFHAVAMEDGAAKEEDHYTKARRYYARYVNDHAEAEDVADVHYEFAQLLLDNDDDRLARDAFRSILTSHPTHARAEESAYAAMYISHQLLGSTPKDHESLPQARQDYVADAEYFVLKHPAHEQAVMVADRLIRDIYAQHDYQSVVRLGGRLLIAYPNESALTLTTYRLRGHAWFEQARYVDAQQDYRAALAMTDGNDRTLVDNLAEAIYREAEVLARTGTKEQAITTYLSVEQEVPGSSFAVDASFAAFLLMAETGQTERAIATASSLRALGPERSLSAQISMRMAIMHEERDDPLSAATEYDRLTREADDTEIVREAMLSSARLYVKADRRDRARELYQSYVDTYAAPMHEHLEAALELADLYWAIDHRTIAKRVIDRAVDHERESPVRDDLSSLLAAGAMMKLADWTFEDYLAVELVAPLKPNLDRKRRLMQEGLHAYETAVGYRHASITTKATYRIASIYEHFGAALLSSERPSGLGGFEKEQYELQLEEQAYPFEERSIAVFRKNVELIPQGIYDEWVSRTMQKLADMLPALYQREERRSEYLMQIDGGAVRYSEMMR